MKTFEIEKTYTQVFETKIEDPISIKEMIHFAFFQKGKLEDYYKIETKDKFIYIPKWTTF